MILRMFQKTFYKQGHRSRSVLTGYSVLGAAAVRRDGRKTAGPPAGAQEHPEPRNVRSIASSARRRPAARASRPAAVDRISADHEWSAKVCVVGDADGTRLLAPSGVRLEPVGGFIGLEGNMWAAMCAGGPAAGRGHTGPRPSVSVRGPRSAVAAARTTTTRPLRAYHLVGENRQLCGRCPPVSALAVSEQLPR